MCWGLSTSGGTQGPCPEVVNTGGRFLRTVKWMASICAPKQDGMCLVPGPAIARVFVRRKKIDTGPPGGPAGQ